MAAAKYGKGGGLTACRNGKEYVWPADGGHTGGPKTIFGKAKGMLREEEL